MPLPKSVTHKPKGKNKPALKPPVAESENATEGKYSFELELQFVIDYLERDLYSGFFHEDIVKDAEKALKVLKSAKQPVVKKRIVMKSMLGNYREKMAREAKELSLASENIKFTEPKEPKTGEKSHFVKRSAAVQKSRNDFKFNFNVDTENEESLTLPLGSEDKEATNTTLEPHCSKNPDFK
ncbi:hypothetical protein DMENIID0001_150770 [Sergentomyia squamirostris]